MSGTAGVDSKTVGYVIKGTYGGEYGQLKGEDVEWHSDTPTVFKTVVDAIRAIGRAHQFTGATIEKAVETTYHETKTSYEPL